MAVKFETMQGNKPKYKQQDGANFVMYEKIRLQLRTSDTLKNTNGYKNSLTKEYFLLGNEYYKKNEYNLSASFYDSALKHNYECPEVHNNLGVIFALLRREDNAIDCFKNSIKANLNQLFAFINLANIYIKIGNYSQGFEMYFQLMSKSKEKRILEHFNKILKNYNVFYKFIRKHLRIVHKKFDLEDILKLILKDVSKTDPIATSFSSIQNQIDEVSSAKLKSIFDEVKLRYSNLQWNKLRTELYYTDRYIKQFAELFKDIPEKEIRNAVCLMYVYIFIEKAEAPFSTCFYSLIDKTGEKTILNTYMKLFQSIQTLKKSNFPALKDTKSSPNEEPYQEYQNTQVLLSIQRLFFHEKFYMYHLCMLKNGEPRFTSVEEIQVFAYALSDLAIYKHAAAHYHKQYQEKISAYFNNCVFPNAYGEFILQRDIAQLNFRELIAQQPNYVQTEQLLKRELASGFCDIKMEIEIYTLWAFMYFQQQKYEQAIQLCEWCLKQYPSHKDQFYQYIGSIYLFINQHKKAVSNFNSAVQLNPMNEQAHFQLSCLYYFYNIRDKAIDHLFKTITANPSGLQHYSWLAFVYENNVQHRELISNFVSDIQKDFTRATDFKVKSNIAIFQLQSYNFNESYDFFKHCLNEGAKDDDTNCQDLQLFYFVNKISWIYFYYEMGEPQQYALEMGLYLIIFINATFLLIKYHKESHEMDDRLYDRINQNIGRLIVKNCIGVVDYIYRFDDEHRNIIYEHIFKNIPKTVPDLDLQPFYRLLIDKHPELQEYVWAHEAASQIKQWKLERFKEFFAYLQGHSSVNSVDYFTERTDLIKVDIFLNRLSTICELQEVMKLFKKLFKQTCIKFQFDWLEKFSIYFAQTNLFVSIAWRTSEKLKKCKDLQSLRKLAVDFRKEILKCEVVVLVYREFHYFIKGNEYLRKHLDEICEFFLNNQDLQLFLPRLVDCINEDFEQNSSIHLQSSVRDGSYEESFEHSHLSSISDYSLDKDQINKSIDEMEIPKVREQPPFQGHTKAILSYIHHNQKGRQTYSILKRGIQDPVNPKYLQPLAKSQLVLAAVTFLHEMEQLGIFVHRLSMNDLRREWSGFSLTVCLKLSTNCANSQQKMAYQSTSRVIRQSLKIMRKERYNNQFSPRFQRILEYVQYQSYCNSLEEKVQMVMQKLQKQTMVYHLICLIEFIQQLYSAESQIVDGSPSTLASILAKGKIDKPLRLCYNLLAQGKLSYPRFITKMKFLLDKKQSNENHYHENSMKDSVTSNKSNNSQTNLNRGKRSPLSEKSNSVISDYQQ